MKSLLETTVRVVVFLQLVWTVVCTVACASSGSLRDRDYESSLASFREQRPDRAIAAFPAGEKGGFVTSVEKAWLTQWEGHWDPGLLQSHAETLEHRQQILLSHEAATFWHQENEEDYVPAEHEV